jgi:hypothetical protein
MIRIAIFAAGAAIALAAPAEAKQARCYNTEDGWYACKFRQFGGDGSFTVSAPGRPSYTVSMVGRGVADGFADYGEGNLLLPGTFYRSDRDRACWISDVTNFAICAY